MILGIHGEHGSGKDALIEKMINELSSQYNVAVIKDMPNEFSVDPKSTDTRRHGRTEAVVVVESSESESSFIFNEGLSLDEIKKKLDVIVSPDLVLVEGHSDANIPGIVLGDVEPGRDTVIRYDNNIEDITSYIRDTIETEKILENLPKLNCGKCGYDCRVMAELINKGEKNYTDCVIGVGIGNLVIDVDGTSLAVGGFVEEIFKSTILGMVSSLKGAKGAKDPREIRIKVRYGDSEEKI